MKVLITGGMGVIGAETTRKFVREGHRPIVFARHRDDRLVGDILDKIDFEAGDILDLPRLLGVIKQHSVTHIVHAAAFVGAMSAANPAFSIQVNVGGTVNVLEAARLFDVKRVVYTSAKGVYGPFVGDYGPPHYRPVPEDAPKNPQRIYDSAKLMAEQTSLYYANNFGIDVAILRFAMTYGPGKTARHGKMGVSSQIVESPFHGLPFKHPSGRDAKDDFIYNKDSRFGHLSGNSRREGTEPRLQHREWSRPRPQRYRRSGAQADPECRDRDRPRRQLPRYALSAARYLRRDPRAERTGI